LLAAGITRAQVSIDWPAGATNRKSKFATAEASLARVLKNINFLSSDIKVTLRINTAPGFLATFPELIEQIKRTVTRKVGLYCHRLYESNEASLNNQSAAQLRYDNAASYAEDFMRAKAIIRAFGYPYEYVPEQVPIGQCIAQSDDDILFNDEGAMRKCPREIHGEGAEVYGDGTKNTQAHFYQNAQAADDLDCRRCAYLPVCHGGCVKEFYHAPTNKLNRCTLWKFTLEDELTHFLEDLPNERTHCDAQSQSHD
jgi:radical SAM protein with 4Fe4S-binding SPASM domain